MKRYDVTDEAHVTLRRLDIETALEWGGFEVGIETAEGEQVVRVVLGASMTEVIEAAQAVQRRGGIAPPATGSLGAPGSLDASGGSGPAAEPLHPRAYRESLPGSPGGGFVPPSNEVPTRVRGHLLQDYRETGGLG